MWEKGHGSRLREEIAGWVGDIREFPWFYIGGTACVAGVIAFSLWFADNADSISPSKVRDRASGSSNRNPTTELIYQCKSHGPATMIIYEGDTMTSCNAIRVPVAP